MKVLLINSLVTPINLAVFVLPPYVRYVTNCGLGEAPQRHEAHLQWFVVGEIKYPVYTDDIDIDAEWVRSKILGYGYGLYSEPLTPNPL